MSVSLAAVRAAAERVRAGGALRTPVLTNAAIDALAGVSVHFKCEHLQRTGSFKLRGALSAVFALDDATAARGVVAHSSGNHGAAVAAAAAARAVPCTIVVPATTPQAKQEAIRRLGATLVLCEPTQRARTETSEREAARTGAALVHPYDDDDVIAGQGTIALELLEGAAPDGGQLSSSAGVELDAILVPVSGGGLIGGIAAAAAELRPAVRVIACEPAGKGLGRALAGGTRVLDAAAADAPIDTICDAIRTVPLGRKAWELVRSHVEPTVLSVSDDEVRAALRLTLAELKQAVEPAGAVALAGLLSPQFAALREAEAARGRPIHAVGVVVCGGNADLQLLAEHIRH